MSRLSLIVLVAAVTVASNGATAQPRRISSGRWIERARIEDFRGGVLLRPELIARSGSNVLVYDSGDFALLAFGTGGQPIWRFGRKGGGPGEFGSVADLKGDGAGGAMLLDPGYSRITEVSGAGALAAVTPVDQVLHRIGAGARNSLVGAPLNDALLVRLRGEAGPATVALPTSLRQFGPLQRENYLGTTSSGTFVITHRWSTTVLVVAPDFRTEREFQLIDAQPFPELKTFKAGPSGQYAVSRIDPAARAVLRTQDVVGDTLFVIDARTAAAPQKLLDAYNVSTGKYLYSQMIPEYPRAIARVAGRLFAIVSEPVPALVIWDWIPSRAP